MAKFENNIQGFIPQEDWLDIGFNVTRQNDPIDGLLGDIKTDNLVAQWETIASEYQIPVMAQFHAFDTESRKTFRIPVDTHNIEKGLIKVKLNQSERMRTLLRSGVQNDALYDYVMNDGIRLAEQVFTRSKVAKNELLASGQVTIKENNLDLTVDYGVPAANLALTIDLSASADIPAQIQQIVDDAQEQGVTINGILTSKANVLKMRANSAMQTVINGTVGVGATVRAAAFNDFMEEEYGIFKIITNDLTYGADATIGVDGRPSITTARYYPKNKITFFATNPAGRVGTGLWGDAPEIDDVDLTKLGNGGVPYVLVSQWFEKDPHVLWTKASGLFMPVLYNPNGLFVATVEDGAEGETGSK